MVFLRMQPSKQSYLNRRTDKMLEPKFYKPFKELRKVGDVSYQLELLLISKIHNTFISLILNRCWSKICNHKYLKKNCMKKKISW